MGFASLQHMKHRRYAFRELCLPATFRLQGLVTLLTAYSLRSRAGFVSHRPRSWDLPFGAFSSWKVSKPFPAWKHPHTVHSSVLPCTQGARAGSTSRSFWALTLPGFFAETLTGISPSLLSRASQQSLRFTAGASESRSVSASLHPPA